MQLSLTFLEWFAIVKDLCPAVGPDALQSHNTAPGGFQLHQGRPQPGAAVAQAPQQLIAGHAAPQLGARETPAGNDEPLAVQGFLPEFQPEAVLHFSDLFHLGPQLYLDVGLFQSEAQHIHHGIGLVGIGVDPARFLRHREKPQGAEPIQGFLRGERPDGVF